MQWRLNFVGNDSGFYLTALVVMLSFLLVWLAQTTLFWRLGNRLSTPLPKLPKSTAINSPFSRQMSHHTCWHHRSQLFAFLLFGNCHL